VLIFNNIYDILSIMKRRIADEVCHHIHNLCCEQGGGAMIEYILLEIIKLLLFSLIVETIIVFALIIFIIIFSK